MKKSLRNCYSFYFPSLLFISPCKICSIIDCFNNSILNKIEINIEANPETEDFKIIFYELGNIVNETKIFHKEKFSPHMFKGGSYLYEIEENGINLNVEIKAVIEH